jgi:hypothetical protein
VAVVVVLLVLPQTAVTGQPETAVTVVPRVVARVAI